MEEFGLSALGGGGGRRIGKGEEAVNRGVDNDGGWRYEVRAGVSVRENYKRRRELEYLSNQFAAKLYVRKRR